MEGKAIRSIFVVCVMSMLIFSTIGTTVRADGGATAGAVVSIGIALVNEIKEAIQSYGTAIVYVKAKTDGPDSDDRAVDYELDRDCGLDWSLDAWTDLVKGMNNVDDGEETPYSPGEWHGAYIELHFDSTGGVWKPDPDDCRLCPNNKKAPYGCKSVIALAKHRMVPIR